MRRPVKRGSPFKGWKRDTILSGPQYVRAVGAGRVLLVDRCPGLDVWRWRCIHRTPAGCIVQDSFGEPFPSASAACAAALAALEHEVTFQKRSLGLSRVGGRLVGYRLACSCGWTTKVNGPKRYAQGHAADHKREARGR